jgi:hypothetical protein
MVLKVRMLDVPTFEEKQRKNAEKISKIALTCIQARNS